MDPVSLPPTRGVFGQGDATNVVLGVKDRSPRVETSLCCSAFGLARVFSSMSMAVWRNCRVNPQM
jgi:hypothetical protein